MTSNTPTANVIGSRTKWASLAAIALQPWQMIFDAMARRRTNAALSALNDHQLKDIGISRSEIAWRCRSVNLPRRYVDPE
jgi:uncharacterized protein YjiS (DUF1127 family)